MTRSTFTNALLGALVSVIFSFIPLSPVVGGAVSGYLQEKDGARVGGYAGVLAAIPLVLVVLGLLSLFMFASDGIFVLLGLVALLVVAYSVALSMLGGYLGVYFATRRAEKRAERVVEGAA